VTNSTTSTICALYGQLQPPSSELESTLTDEFEGEVIDYRNFCYDSFNTLNGGLDISYSAVFAPPERTTVSQLHSSGQYHGVFHYEDLPGFNLCLLSSY
jgi:hypothetical protein